MGMEVVREFVQTIVGANDHISNTTCEAVNTVLLRHSDEGIAYGFTSSAEEANNFIQFFEDNGVTIHPDLNEFIQRWRKIPYPSNPRFGFEATRSLEGPIIFIGGKIKHQENWFINDYDFSEGLPANTDIRNATDGGIKLGWDTNLNRFTSIKLYSRSGEEPLGHNSFRIDANNDVTFYDRTFCSHHPAFTSANNAPERWANNAQDIITIVNKYNGVDGVGIAWRTTERIADSDGNWGQDQGGITFTVWQKKPQPPSSFDPNDINNPYRYITEPNENEWHSPANTANTHAD